MTELADEIRSLFIEKLGREAQRDKTLGDTFDEQRDFILDPSPLKSALCGRRAGKTVAAAKILRLGATEMPDAASLYLSMTRGQAKNIMWNVLKKECGSGFEFSEIELTAKAENGHRIICSGADNPGMLERLRGTAYYKVVVDEPASFNPEYLRYLIEDILTPAMADYGPSAQLSAIGTPNAICGGYFFDITNRDLGWSVHKWTLRENALFPYWRNNPNWEEIADQYLKSVLVKMNWDEQNPIYQREYLGRWVRDDSSIVYRLNRDTNTYSELPGLDYQTIIGVDLGYDDATAFEVVGFSEESPLVYELDGFEQTGMIPTEVSEKLKEFIAIYRPIAIVCDTGGLAKAIVEEMKRRFSLPVKPAEKTKKLDYIEMLNDDLRTGKIKVRADSPLIDEWAILQWDKDRKKEDERFKNHRSDAFLYAWRESLHWNHRPKTVIPHKFSPERAQWEADEMLRQWQERYQDTSKQNWWKKTP